MNAGRTPMNADWLSRISRGIALHLRFFIGVHLRLAFTRFA